MTGREEHEERGSAGGAGPTGGRQSTDGSTSADDESSQGAQSTDGGRPTDVERSVVTVYRWTCPICGRSRMGIATSGEDPVQKAEFSLCQHVRTTIEDGHGPANAFPPGFDPDGADRMVSVN